MTRIKQLRTSKGIKQIDLCKQIGVTQGALSGWETGRYEPDVTTLKKLSEIFEVSIDYILGDKEDTVPKTPTINAKDEKDIAKDLDSIMEKLTNKEDGPASFNGEDMSEETTALFKDELERALRILKVINKEKYNPNKNKSR